MGSLIINTNARKLIGFLFLGAEQARAASQMSQLDAPEARSAAMALLLGG